MPCIILLENNINKDYISYRYIIKGNLQNKGSLDYIFQYNKIIYAIISHISCG